MLVTCPECQTKYDLPDDKITAEGTHVRCTRCKNEFSVDAETSQSQNIFGDDEFDKELDEAFAGLEDSSDANKNEDVELDEMLMEGDESQEDTDDIEKDIEDLFGPDENVQPPQEPESEPPSEPLSEPKEEPVEEVEEEPTPSQEVIEEDLADDLFDFNEPAPSVEDPSPAPQEADDILEDELIAEITPEPDDETFPVDPVPDMQEEPLPPPVRPKKKSKTLSILLLIVCLFGAGYYTFPYYKEMLPGFITGETTSIQDKKEGESTDEQTPGAKAIALKDIRQYYEDNESIGRLLVIEGKAVNASQSPKELIKLRASLYDKNGKEVRFKEFLGGNVVSQFQLKVMKKEKLDAALQAKVGILTNNTNIQPNKHVSFMVVFYSPPKTVQDFGLKVIEAKDPPK